MASICNTRLEAMLWFEKSLIGVYCNRFNDLEERHDPFSCYGRIKANRADKSINVTNIYMEAVYGSVYMEAGPRSRQIGLPLTSSFRLLSK